MHTLDTERSCHHEENMRTRQMLPFIEKKETTERTAQPNNYIRVLITDE